MNSLATLPVHRFDCGRCCSPFTFCLPHACIRFRKFLHEIHVTVGAAGKSSTVLGSAFGAEHTTYQDLARPICGGSDASLPRIVVHQLLEVSQRAESAVVVERQHL